MLLVLAHITEIADKNLKIFLPCLVLGTDRIGLPPPLLRGSTGKEDEDEVWQMLASTIPTANLISETKNTEVADKESLETSSDELSLECWFLIGLLLHFGSSARRRRKV
nr:BPK_HP1_G0044000.mRNA.1.CDS.1 [Saccharomyces cerevisiae]